MHITLQSPVAYHCCSYALSDSSDFFHNPCTDHEHDQVCIDCKNLDDTLQLILEKTTARNWDNQDAFLFKVIILELIFFIKFNLFVKFLWNLFKSHPHPEKSSLCKPELIIINYNIYLINGFLACAQLENDKKLLKHYHYSWKQIPCSIWTGDL